MITSVSRRVFVGLMLSSAAQVSWAAPSAVTKDQEICRQLNSGKAPAAILMNNDRIHAVSSVDLGILDTTSADTKHDVHYSSKEYRLILYPSRLTTSTMCSMSVCIETTKVAPFCAGTSEYLVRIGVTSWKFGPGRFSTNVEVEIDDPQSDYPPEFAALDAVELTGVISLPWLDVERTPLVPENGGPTSAGFRLTNVGDRPVQLASWKKGDAASKAITLQDSGCMTLTIAPGQTCSGRFTVTSDFLVPGKHAEWLTTSKDGRYTYTLYVDVDTQSKLNIAIRNR